MRPAIGPKELDEELAELYGQGSCHVFAMAALSRFGGKGYRVFFDPSELSYEPEEDSEEDEIPSVVHVVAVVEIDEADWAVDVFGARPLRDADAEVEARYATGDLIHADYGGEEELRTLISQGTPDLRDALLPLHEVTGKLIDEALSHLADADWPDDLQDRQKQTSEPEGP